MNVCGIAIVVAPDDAENSDDVLLESFDFEMRSNLFLHIKVSIELEQEVEGNCNFLQIASKVDYFRFCANLVE